MSKPKFFWHGEPVKVRFGQSEVRVNKEKPLTWYNYECGECGNANVPTIEITTEEGQVFTIANHFGIGVRKLYAGGWPNKQHFSVPEGTFQEEAAYQILEFDSKGFAGHEKLRQNWQQEKFPQEYERMQQFIKAFNLKR